VGGRISAIRKSLKRAQRKRLVAVSVGMSVELRKKLRKHRKEAKIGVRAFLAKEAKV
jgi:hypothetical protein